MLQLSDPGLVVAQWFPATVLLPDGTVHRRARVYVTTGHVIVYTRRPADGEQPDWHAVVDLDATPRPTAGTPSAGAGIDLVTDEGLVVVTPEGGCGCSNALKRWQPTWADATTPWPGR